MPLYSSVPGILNGLPLSHGGTLLYLGGTTEIVGDPSNPDWRTTDKYSGHPSVVADVRNFPKKWFPSHYKVRTEETGPIWEVQVEYARVDLLSTWDIDTNQVQQTISVSEPGLALDTAFAGWTRFIEWTVDQHFQTNLTGPFDFETIQSSALDGPFTPVDGYSLAELNYLATEYAKMYILGQTSFPSTQWVVRNELLVSAEFNWSHWPKLTEKVNYIYTPQKMQFEALLPGEIIPAGIIVPGVKYWLKEKVNKQQTSRNQFVITRQWRGFDWFNPLTYKTA